jgi:hypothetical protein
LKNERRRFTQFGSTVASIRIIKLTVSHVALARCSLPPTVMYDFLTLVAVLSLQLVRVVSSSAQSSFSSDAPRYKDNTNSNAPGQYHLNANWGLPYDGGLFTPVEDLSFISDTGFTTFGHPAFPRHSVRIKKTPSGFCDDTIRFATFVFPPCNQHVSHENLRCTLKGIHRIH